MRPAGHGPKPALAGRRKPKMATATNIRTPRKVVDFPANTPVPVALQYGQGKTISNQHGERMMYSLTDGRVMFLDLEVAGQIESAGINVRESFTITRKTDGPKGSPITWEVARIPGEQPTGTLVLDAPDTPAPKPPASATTLDSGMVPRKPVSSTLVD